MIWICRCGRESIRRFNRACDQCLPKLTRPHGGNYRWKIEENPIPIQTIMEAFPENDSPISSLAALLVIAVIVIYVAVEVVARLF